MILFKFLGQLAYQYTSVWNVGSPKKMYLCGDWRPRTFIKNVKQAWRLTKLQQWYDRPYKETCDEAMRQRGYHVK